MIRPPPTLKRPATLCPYPTLFRSSVARPMKTLRTPGCYPIHSACRLACCPILPWRGRRTDLRDCAMTKTDSKAIATLLLAAVDLRERLAFGMFRVDNPQASKTDLDASDRSRYFAYAASAMDDLLEGSTYHYHVPASMTVPGTEEH